MIGFTFFFHKLVKRVPAGNDLLNWTRLAVIILNVVLGIFVGKALVAQDIKPTSFKVFVITKNYGFVTSLRLEHSARYVCAISLI
jgi:hypothetical protein